MDKKKLKELVSASYDGKVLQEDTVMQITQTLNRKMLKAYIRALKSWENKQTVIITTPEENSDIKTLSTLFLDKNVTHAIDPSLILGVKIQDNDMIYEMSLKNRFDTMLSQLDA